MGDALLQILFLGLGYYTLLWLSYYTGKVLLRVLSLTVEDRPGPWWSPFSRLPDGTLAVSHDAATQFGSLPWIIIIVVGLIALVRA